MNLYIKRAQDDCFEAIAAEPISKELYNVTSDHYSEEYHIVIPRNGKIDEQRIFYMAEHQPQSNNTANCRICLPVAAVYDDKRSCIGYMTLKPFEKSESLNLLTSYNARPMAQMRRLATKTQWHNKFERDEVGIKNRYKMLYNIVKALHAIPECYIWINLTPEDIEITANGKVSISGLYNSRIEENGAVTFAELCYTTSYTAPEVLSSPSASSKYTQNATLFNIAVMAYSVLTGTHPYSGSILHSPYDKCIEISECIKNHLFPFGDRAQYISLPQGLNLHQAFHAMPQQIQRLFKAAFSSSSAQRPTLHEWGTALYEHITKG